MDIHILYFREIDNEILKKNNNRFFQEDFIKELFSSNKKINFIHQDYDAKKDYNSKNIILYCHDLRHYKKYFEKFKKKNYLVIHLFDENLGHDVSLYKNENVKHIFREMIRPALDQKKITNIPLGYKSGLIEYSKPSNSNRIYKWSFCGFLNKNGRDKFCEKLKEIKPYYCFNTKATWSFDLNSEEYSDILNKTLFVPCFSGNTNIETQRLVEALEHGCIPIVNKYYKFPILRTRYLKYDYHNYNYYENLFGEHPLPIVDNSYSSYYLPSSYYSMFATKVKQLLIEENVEELRLNIQDWWNNYKKKLKIDISNTVYNSFIE